MLTTTSLALSILLTLTQEEATRSEPPAPAAVQAPAPSAPVPDGAAPTCVPEDAFTTGTTPGKRELSRVTLRDGQQLHGVVVYRDARLVVLELATGGRLELPAHQVESVEAEPQAQVRVGGEVWLPDPNRTRYLYAPSGMMLRQGEGYFSQKELFFSSMNYGLTDHITVQVGAVVPAWLVENGFHIIGGIKVGGSVTDRLHLAVGAQGLFLPSLGSNSAAMGFFFGTATYGTPDTHLSLAVGAPFLFDGGEHFLAGDYLVALSGTVRMNQRLSLVTENWLWPTLGPSDGPLPMLNSLALRIFGERWAVDIGGIRVPEVPIPIPWLDFTYNFG